MVVCRYFLQPSGCRYGDKCHFDHVADGGYAEEPEYDRRGPRDSYQPSRDFRNPRYPSQPQRFHATRGGYEQPGFRGSSTGFQNSYRQPAPAASYDLSGRYPSTPYTTDAEILEDIGKDIQSLWSQSSTSVFQKGKIWPFSTYSYISPDGTIRTDPLFGLVDHSMEELRLAAYSARSDQNALQAYVQEVNKQGNSVRLMCTSICNAADLPHSEGAKKILEEVRTKSAQHDAVFRQIESSQPTQFAGGPQPTHYPSPTPYPSPGFTPSMPTPSFSSPANGQATVQSSAEPRGAYSDTNMLTAEDFLQFASPEFTQGKVPYRPPPRNLC